MPRVVFVTINEPPALQLQKKKKREKHFLNAKLIPLLQSRLLSGNAKQTKKTSLRRIYLQLQICVFSCKRAFCRHRYLKLQLSNCLRPRQLTPMGGKASATLLPLISCGQAGDVQRGPEKGKRLITSLSCATLSRSSLIQIRPRCLVRSPITVKTERTQM